MATSSTDSQPPAKKLRLSFTDTIKVLVGEEKRAFTIHKDIVSNRAPFFEAACSERWLDKSGSVALPEDDALVFNIYLSCVYNNHVDIGDIREKWPNETLDFSDQRIDERLVKSWVLADKLGGVLPANMLVDEYTLSANERNALPPFEVVAYVTKSLPTESPFHHLFTDYFLHEVTSKTLLEELSEKSVPRSFLQKVLQEKTDLSRAGSTEGIRYHNCRYRLHNEEHPFCGMGCTKIPKEESSGKKQS